MQCLALIVFLCISITRESHNWSGFVEVHMLLLLGLDEKHSISNAISRNRPLILDSSVELTCDVR